MTIVRRPHIVALERAEEIFFSGMVMRTRRPKTSFSPCRSLPVLSAHRIASSKTRLLEDFGAGVFSNPVRAPAAMSSVCPPEDWTSDGAQTTLGPDNSARLTFTNACRLDCTNTLLVVSDLHFPRDVRLQRPSVRTSTHTLRAEWVSSWWAGTRVGLVDVVARGGIAVVTALAVEDARSPATCPRSRKQKRARQGIGNNQQPQKLMRGNAGLGLLARWPGVGCLMFGSGARRCSRQLSWSVHSTYWLLGTFHEWTGIFTRLVYSTALTCGSERFSHIYATYFTAPKPFKCTQSTQSTSYLPMRLPQAYI